jgi:hypothetical protein
MISLTTRQLFRVCAAVCLLLPASVDSVALADDPVATLQRLVQAIESEDARAVAELYAGEGARGSDEFRRRWRTVFVDYDDLEVELEVLQQGVAGARALARSRYTVTGHMAGQIQGPRYLIAAETVDMPLEQQGARWLLGPQEWPRPDAERSVADLLASSGSMPEGAIVHMVLQMKAGLWWPVRHLAWIGEMPGKRGAKSETDTRDAVSQTLEKRHAAKQPGTIHIFAGKQGEEWRIAQDVWHARAEGADVEEQLRAQTARVEEAFGDATQHVQLADLLEASGSYALAVEEYEKASALQPSVVASEGLARARGELRREERRRGWDERMNAERAMQLAAEGGRLARKTSGISRQMPSQFLMCDYATVRHQSGDPLMADVMAAVEESHRKAVTMFGLPMERVAIAVFRTRQEYQAFRRFRGETDVPEWSGGTSGVDGILTYSHEGVGKSIAHEYGHEAVHQFVQDVAVPMWLNEGVATIMEDSFGDHERLTAELYRMPGRSFFSIDDLSGSWTALGSQKARYAYAQARGMVEFLLARWGRDAVLNILRDLRRGASYDQAFARNIGVPQAGFQQQWAQHTLTRMPRSRRGARGSTQPAAADPSDR